MKKTIFANGLSFYKLLCVFVIGGVLGDLAETVFCKIRTKKWMRRSSFIYGHLSAVWGFAFVIASVLCFTLGDRSVFCTFVIGILLGGIYEYICSLFTENFMGVKFWDYEKIPFNLFGRINLLYCVFWGFANIIWCKGIFPWLNQCIGQIPEWIGIPICNVLFVFLCIDATISLLAIKRYEERHMEEYDNHRFGRYFDKHYPDERIERLYENLQICGNIRGKSVRENGEQLTAL